MKVEEVFWLVFSVKLESESELTSEDDVLLVEELELSTISELVKESLIGDELSWPCPISL